MFVYRGCEGFFIKISNLDSEDRGFSSLAEYNKTAETMFVPRASNSFVMYSQFPDDYVSFKRFVVKELKLPRLAEPVIIMYCSFSNEFRKLDDSRYRAVKTCYDLKGRPALEAHRKVYVICDWAQLQK